MRHGFYSPFWLAGGVLTSPAWAERDALEARIHPAEGMSFGAWLALSEAERGDVVESYAHRRPREVAMRV